MVKHVIMREFPLPPLVLRASPALAHNCTGCVAHNHADPKLCFQLPNCMPSDTPAFIFVKDTN